MAEYLLLVKITPEKIIDVLTALRSLPGTPSEGVDLNYTMNIFGTWDVGIWFKANKTDEATAFVSKKIKDIAGVTEVHTVPTFPHEK